MFKWLLSNKKETNDNKCGMFDLGIQIIHILSMIHQMMIDKNSLHKINK